MGIIIKMYNFFVNSEQIQNNKVKIQGQDAKHISSVLSMKNGEKLYINNKENEEKFLAEIENIQKDEINCLLLDKVDSVESDIKVTLFQGMPKADKMEYIIQKAIELGIYEIVPIEMKNCIFKLKDNKKIERWQAIAESAAKQSKRNIIPKIRNAEKISNIKNEIKDYDLVLIAYEDENKTTLKKVLKNRNNLSNIAIVIGPEGGIDKSEVDELTQNGAISASLGKRILRTETASVVLLSMILYEYEL